MHSPSWLEKIQILKKAEGSKHDWMDRILKFEFPHETEILGLTNIRDSFLIPLDLFSWAKMGILTSVTCTTRRLCTFSAWGPTSWPQRGRCNPESRGRTKTNSGGQNVYGSFWSGPERNWTTESTRALMSMLQTTRRTPACTTLQPRAWKLVLRWDSQVWNFRYRSNTP